MLKCLNVQMLRLLIVPLSETKRFRLSQSFQIKMMKQKSSSDLIASKKGHDFWMGKLDVFKSGREGVLKKITLP